MAKWGEGDPRWIVEERPDVRNVGNYHWTESNCFPWSENYLKTNLQNVKVEEAEKSAELTGIPDVEGEATVGNRKGKVYYIYDMSITLRWKGDTDVESATGKIKVSDVTQDDDVNDYHYEVTCNDETPLKKPIKDFVQQKLLPEVKKKLLDFRKDLKAEHEKVVLLPTKTAGNATNGTHDPKQKAPQSKTESEKSASDSASAKKSNIETRTVSMKVELLASAQDIFDTLTNPGRVQVWTRDKAEVSVQPGSKFSFFGGHVSGEMISVTSHKRIEQKWRLRDWPEGHYSNVVIELDQGRSSTEVFLTQTGVPQEHFDTTAENWNRFYWNQIKGIFGWGIIDQQ